MKTTISKVLYDVLSDYSLGEAVGLTVDKMMSDPAYRWDAGRHASYTDDGRIVRSGWIGTHRKYSEIHYFVEVLGDALFPNELHCSMWIIEDD